VNTEYSIQEAKPSDYSQLGKLMVDVYSRLEGFPSPTEIPDYCNSLRNVGDFLNSPSTKLFVAISNKGKIDGGWCILEI